MQSSTVQKYQRAFFRKAGENVSLLKAVVDTMRDVGFYITDDKDRIMAFTRRNCEECNVPDESAVIGKTCAELFPDYLAEVYMERDRRVRRTGIPIVNEVFSHSVDHSTDMRIVSVFPIHGRGGRIIGTVCTYRTATAGETVPEWYGRVRTVIAHIDAHYAERLTLQNLADVAGMSVATFRRVFAETMQMTPIRYLNTIRINAARRLLTRTDKLVSEIAVATGFWDQSHFIKAFRAERGQTPTEYRREHWHRG